MKIKFYSIYNISQFLINTNVFKKKKKFDNNSKYLIKRFKNIDNYDYCLLHCILILSYIIIVGKLETGILS